MAKGSRFDAAVKAVYRKEYRVLEGLLKTREGVSMVDGDGRTLLMHAVLAEDADPKMVRFLVGLGVNVDVADAGQRWTALHFAARDQKPEVVSALIDAGAQVDPVDSFGNTPLWRSVMGPRTDVSVVQRLLQAGANPQRKNKHGSSPVDVAAKTGKRDLLALLTISRE